MSAQTDKNGTAETLARRFHETYERLAPSFGYETRKDTRAFDPQSPNGKLMIAVCSELEAQPSEPRLTVDQLREEMELLGSMIRAERSTATEANRQCTDEQLERCYQLGDRLAKAAR